MDRMAQFFAIARALLAATSLVTHLILAPVRSILVTTAITLFALSSVLTLKRRMGFQTHFGLIALFLDTVFFMVLAKYGAREMLWLAPVFYLYLLSTAVALYGPREVIVVAGGCILFFAMAHPGSQYILRETILVAGAFACAYSIQKKKIERKSEELADEADRQRQAVQAAREAEQQRIAADFHDGPLQSMISFQMRLEILKKLFERDRDAGMQELAALQEMSKAQVREIRSFVRIMRPLDVDGASLPAATRRLVDEFEKESGIPVTFVGGERAFSAAPETCTDVLQMIREALNNVRKHAKATRVAVGIEKVGKILEVSIDDNGVGFHFAGNYSLDELDLLRLGPVSLKRRARSVGAEMLLESRPGRGAGIKLKIPI
jgi:signal transduction histidine kinase